jgi:hypothetical protein
MRTTQSIKTLKAGVKSRRKDGVKKADGGPAQPTEKQAKLDALVREMKRKFDEAKKKYTPPYLLWLPLAQKVVRAEQPRLLSD